MKRDDKWPFKPTEQQILLGRQIAILTRQFQDAPKDEKFYWTFRQ